MRHNIGSYSAGPACSASQKAGRTALTKVNLCYDDRSRKIDDMDLSNTATVKRDPANVLIRYVRSLQHVLGNRRRSARLPICGTVTVGYESYGVVTPNVCSCVDISTGGLGINCAEPMMPNMVIKLSADENRTKRLARVRYCEQHGMAYRIGLQFISDDHETRA